MKSLSAAFCLQHSPEPNSSSFLDAITLTLAPTHSATTSPAALGRSCLHRLCSLKCRAPFLPQGACFPSSPGSSSWSLFLGTADIPAFVLNVLSRPGQWEPPIRKENCFSAPGLQTFHSAAWHACSQGSILRAAAAAALGLSPSVCPSCLTSWPCSPAGPALSPGFSPGSLR